MNNTKNPVTYVKIKPRKNENDPPHSHLAIFHRALPSTTATTSPTTHGRFSSHSFPSCSFWCSQVPSDIFNQISCTCRHLHLIENRLFGPVLQKPINGPLLGWYNWNVTCASHIWEHLGIPLEVVFSLATRLEIVRRSWFIVV